MNTNEFGTIFHSQISLCEDTLVRKEGEYAKDDTDRLSQFKIVSAMTGVSPIQAVAGMMAKHTTSIYDMCFSDKNFTPEVWNEKITDHINYLILLKAVVFEEMSIGTNTNIFEELASKRN